MKLVPIQTQIDGAEADLTMYRQAFPTLVARGNHSQGYADWKLAVLEATVHTLKMMLPPPGVTQGTLPVVLHFATEEDRAAFLKETKA